MKTRLQQAAGALLVISTFFIYCTGFAAVSIDAGLAPMLKNVIPAVVNVRAQIKITDFETLQEIQKQRSVKENKDDQPLPTTFTSVGSGVIVDAKHGFILTNAHVVNDAQSMTVTLNDGRHYTAKLIGLDKPSDIALLQIKAKNLSTIPFADSNSLNVGDLVVAIGTPFGVLSQTVTSGIVSALGRTTLGIEGYENFIQTDAPINPGNSGGALINSQGQLVGINTAILAPNRGSIGLGFAIPINMAKSVMDQLLVYGNVKRGLLGIGAQDITPELAEAFHVDTHGAAVTFVLPNSPAQRAGIQPGDIITAVDGHPIKSASDVSNTIGFLRVNSKTSIDILRQNKRINVSVTLIDPKQRKVFIQQTDPFLNGVSLKNFSLLSPLHGNVHGVLVVAVDQDSNAWHADLRSGDVITSVNQQKIKNIDELKAAIAKANKAVLMNVIRGPNALFLVVNKEED